jgi:ankyrin repeat protein
MTIDVNQPVRSYKHPAATPHIVKALLTGRADANAHDEHGGSPMSTLFFWQSLGSPSHLGRVGNAQLLQMLLSAGVSTESPIPVGSTPLLCASQLGDTSAVRILLDHGANIEAVGSGRDTPLATASAFYKPAVVQMLIEHGANVNPRPGMFGSPLRSAIREYNMAEIKLLRARKRHGRPRLDAAKQACSYGYPSIVRMLLEYGANPTIRDNRGFTPLSAAKLWGYTEIVKLLKSHGAKE